MLQFYPSLTPEEFSQACQSLEERCHDRLSGTVWSRVTWTSEELRIIQAVSTRGKGGSGHAESLDGDEGKYGDGDRIMKNQNCDEDHDENKAEIKTEAEIEDNEEEEDQVLPRYSSSGDVLEVTFSITLSPTYSVPILWFTSTAMRSVEDVHRLLMAPHLKDAVKDVGVMGGISRAYHPLSGLPAFFVHPCNTHEALLAAHKGTSLTPEQYLLLWLGVIGSAVGLHIPSKLLVED